VGDSLVQLPFGAGKALRRKPDGARAVQRLEARRRVTWQSGCPILVTGANTGAVQRPPTNRIDGEPWKFRRSAELV